VSTKKPNGKTNLMALSWWTFVSNNPATIAVSINKKAFSHELIYMNKEFGLNIVDESLKISAFLCGTLLCIGILNKVVYNLWSFRDVCATFDCEIQGFGQA